MKFTDISKEIFNRWAREQVGKRELWQKIKDGSYDVDEFLAEISHLYRSACDSHESELFRRFTIFPIKPSPLMKKQYIELTRLMASDIPQKIDQKIRGIKKAIKELVNSIYIELIIPIQEKFKDRVRAFYDHGAGNKATDLFGNEEVYCQAIENIFTCPENWICRKLLTQYYDKMDEIAPLPLESPLQMRALQTPVAGHFAGRPYRGSVSLCDSKFILFTAGDLLSFMRHIQDVLGKNECDALIQGHIKRHRTATQSFSDAKIFSGGGLTESILLSQRSDKKDPDNRTISVSIDMNCVTPIIYTEADRVTPTTVTAGNSAVAEPIRMLERKSEQTFAPMALRLKRRPSSKSDLDRLGDNTNKRNVYFSHS